MRNMNGPLNPRALAAVAAAAVASLAIAACGSYDKEEAEKTITGELSNQVEGATGSPITSASCPDDVELEAGTTFECTATLENGPSSARTAQSSSSLLDAVATRVGRPIPICICTLPAVFGRRIRERFYPRKPVRTTVHRCYHWRRAGLLATGDA